MNSKQPSKNTPGLGFLKKLQLLTTGRRILAEAATTATDDLELHIPLKYTFEEPLGNGAFGRVYRVRKDGYGPFALKVFEVERLRFQGPNASEPLSTEETTQKASREIESLIQLDHPNILRYYSDFKIKSEECLKSWNSRPMGFPTSFPVICIQTALCDASLRDTQDPNPKIQRHLPNLDSNNSKVFLLEIISALKYIHKLGIIHRDLKPENILLKYDSVEDKWATKIGDFGLSRFHTSNGQSVTRKPGGSGYYQSSEQASGETYTNKTDVYSFGVICFEIFCTTGSTDEWKAAQMEKLADVHKEVGQNGLSFCSVDFLGLEESLVELIVLMLCKEEPKTSLVLSKWIRPGSAIVAEVLPDILRKV